MPTAASSSVQRARQVLADRLAELRRDAGLTGRELAGGCGWHASKVSRIENAATPPSAEDIRAQEARLPLYDRTRDFRSYSSWLVPGMIQTAAYTEAALRAVQQRRGLVDDVADALAARLERQRVLYEGDHRFAFLIEESVLRAGIGGVHVMADQLEHLNAVGALPNVSLGVVPMRPDRSRWPVEGFWIYDRAQVNVELVSGYLTITQPREVELYAQAFGELVQDEEAVQYRLPVPQARALHHALRDAVRQLAAG